MLTPTEMLRLRRWGKAYTAQYWGFTQQQGKYLAFVQWLVQTGRIKEVA